VVVAVGLVDMLEAQLSVGHVEVAERAVVMRVLVGGLPGQLV